MFGGLSKTFDQAGGAFSDLASGVTGGGGDDKSEQKKKDTKSVLGMFGGEGTTEDDGVPPPYNYVEQLTKPVMAPTDNLFNLAHNVRDAGSYLKGVLMTGRDCLGRNLKLGDRYFVRSGTCSDLSVAECQGQPRHLYIDNVPSGAMPCADPEQPFDPACRNSQSGLIGGVLNDIVAINPFEIGASMMGNGSVVNDRCVMRTEMVGNTNDGFEKRTRCAPERAPVQCGFKISSSPCTSYDRVGKDDAVQNVPPYALRGLRNVPEISNVEMEALLHGFARKETEDRVVLNNKLIKEVYARLPPPLPEEPGEDDDEGGGGFGGLLSIDWEGGAADDILTDDDLVYTVPEVISSGKLNKNDAVWRKLCQQAMRKFVAYVQGYGDEVIAAMGRRNQVSLADTFSALTHCMHQKKECERGFCLYVWSSVISRPRRSRGFQVRFIACCPGMSASRDAKMAYNDADLIYFANATDIMGGGDGGGDGSALMEAVSIADVDEDSRPILLQGNPRAYELRLEAQSSGAPFKQEVEGFVGDGEGVEGVRQRRLRRRLRQLTAAAQWHSAVASRASSERVAKTDPRRWRLLCVAMVVLVVLVLLVLLVATAAAATWG